MQKEDILIKGRIINPVSARKIEYISDGYITFSSLTGEIKGYGNFTKEIENCIRSFEIIDRSDDYIVPAFFDLHTHIPQWNIRGIGEKSLLYWLNDYVRKEEIDFCNKDKAESVASDFFDALVRSGTATICAYSNGSAESTDIVFKTAEKKGLRLFCGNVLGDLGGFYCRNISSSEMTDRTRKLIDKWHGVKDRLFFCLTPRFALYCSAGFMREISNISKDYGRLFIQTHLSENKNEIAEVLSLHKAYGSYTEIYEDCGLLTDKTLLAHCIYLNDDELALIRERNASIIHCPASNRFLKSGIMPLRRYLDMGMRIGLGTDIGGGYNISVIDELREAIEQSKTLSVIEDRDYAVNCIEGFYIATLGSAEILGIQAKTGSIARGKYADITIIKSNVPIDSTLERILSGIIYNNHKIINVYCMGRKLL